VHNALLQYMLDSGYLGILVMTGFIWACLRRLRLGIRASVPHVHILFALLLYVVVTGITEASATIYHQESLALLFFIAGAVGTLPFQERDVTAARYWRLETQPAFVPAPAGSDA
jgi:O-antigen ligase